MSPFNIVTASLEPGVTLIEASAGTGKTYSITGLILRLILEKQLTIRQILAVTFTEAATEELRDRTRCRLQQAIDDLRSGHSKDEIIAAFLKKKDQIPNAIRDLNLALQSFDEAQIFTIHGFCQRMLTDHAFESGARFETALLIDPLPLFREVAYDFWRLRYYTADSLLPILAMAWQKSPDHWVDLLDQTRRHPDLAVIPSNESTSCETLLRQAEKAFTELTKEWNANQIRIEEILRNDGNLSHSKEKFNEANVNEIVSLIGSAADSVHKINPTIKAALTKVSIEGIEDFTNPTGTPPTHAFFNKTTDFIQIVEALFSRLTHEFLAYAEVELVKRKANTNSVTYDDLLVGLRNALRQDGGKELIRLIGLRYSAAMIDEFQDTDPAQYEIFRTLFHTANHRLFFIGDPKQAIYGFRGADVFTYKEATRIADRQFTLTTNWRSEEPLLRAINALFTGATDPFVLSWIRYHEVHSPSDPNVEALILRDEDKPLNFRLLDSNKDRNEVIARGLANDIAALHQSSATIAKRNLRYRDMAVLVRKYSQAEEVQKALRARGIRSIVQSDHNVFASEEAQELQQFLQGVIDPRRDPQLKAALASNLIGFDAHELVAFDQDDQKRQAWLDLFSTWRELWLDGCFMAMFRNMVVSRNVRSRLVSLPAGERRLTNLLHLAELLHDAESANGFTPDALCSWLREQRNNKRVSQDRFQLRLESDEDAVQIVTVHKSKGLEYPIVFCPFFWSKAESSAQRELLFHDRDSNNRLTFDLRGKSGGTERHRDWQREETLAEELRLLYVAVTRARNRCYIYAPTKIEKSALAQLLQLETKESPADRIRTIAATGKDCIGVASVASHFSQESASPTADEADAVLAARQFEGTISRLTITASFSALNVGESELEEADPMVALESVTPIPRPAGEPDLSIFNFDRGVRAGDFFHDVLEEMDFQNPENLPELIDSKLGLYGFARTSHRPVLKELFERLIEVPVEPDVRLRDVSMRERLSEFEFCYPLAHLAPQDLAKIVGHWKSIGLAAQTRLGKLRFGPIEGFLTGFIDLLFRFKDRYYLVDWKSNWLGHQPSDYGIDGMRRSMLKHNYYLQYHLYTLAADLFLEKRVPGYTYDKNFGGVYYIFLRGIDPNDASRGVFRDRPDAKEIKSLRKLVS
jgi:exodeoxyribonuclease V beta subunit